MADHHGSEHEELPHQAPWVMWVTLGAVASFFTFFMVVKFTVAG
ncbi:MAG: hypothetical protein R3E66_12555 [bacterium]